MKLQGNKVLLKIFAVIIVCLYIFFRYEKAIYTWKAKECQSSKAQYKNLEFATVIKKCANLSNVENNSFNEAWSKKTTAS